MREAPPLPASAGGERRTPSVMAVMPVTDGMVTHVMRGMPHMVGMMPSHHMIAAGGPAAAFVGLHALVGLAPAARRIILRALRAPRGRNGCDAENQAGSQKQSLHGSPPLVEPRQSQPQAGGPILSASRPRCPTVRADLRSRAGPLSPAPRSPRGCSPLLPKCHSTETKRGIPLTEHSPVGSQPYVALRELLLPKG